MENNILYNKMNVKDYVKPILHFPLIYFRYILQTIKEVINHDINHLFTREHIHAQLYYTFIGILTLNFYLYVGIEFGFFHYDFNKMINEIYFIPFYLQSFIIFFILSIILYAFIMTKLGIDLYLLKNILVLNIKMFNMVMPLVFLSLVIVTDLTFYYISINQKDSMLFSWCLWIVSTLILLLTAYLPILFKMKKYLQKVFQNSFISLIYFSLIIFLTVIIGGYTGSKISEVLDIRYLFNKSGFCEEVTSFILFHNGLEPKKEFTFLDYRNEMYKCEKILDMSLSEMVLELQKEEN
ncbi:hypothetical protein LXN10_07580 [Arcobacter sp. KX21116]|uniref:hypothetical protein n=1 Tax=Arcobacter iocasae TaxID=2906515 RepID=UPI0035D4BF33